MSSRTYSLRVACTAPDCRATVCYPHASDDSCVETAIEQAETVGWVVEDEAAQRLILRSDATLTMIVVPALCPACCETVINYLQGEK